MRLIGSRSARSRFGDRGGGPRPIAHGLVGLIDRLGLRVPIMERRALLLWGGVVGSQIAQVAEARRVFQGRLQVRVKTAAWRQTLLFHREEIRKKLNARLGDEVVTQILFK